MQVRGLYPGTTPLLVSVPHAGTYMPPGIKARLSDAGRALPDTDWHVDRLYDFAREMGIGLLVATHSRYVVDLNRGPEDADLYPGQVKTGLCPLETFDGDAIYQEGEEVDAREKANRIGAYWLPYHETLAAELQRLKSQFGYAVLYDAHSIRSEVPRLFDGVLPDLNLGTARGASCDPGMADAALGAAGMSGRLTVINGRFVGGYITRHYGDPAKNIHALQMELTWKNYMTGETPPYAYDEGKAADLQRDLKVVLEALLKWGETRYGGKSSSFYSPKEK